MNWTSVFEIVLGALLGIASSLAVGLFSKLVSAHRLLAKMRQELSSNATAISERITLSDRFELISPIWDYVIRSEILFVFSSRRYARIVTLYGELQAFTKTEKSDAVSQKELEESRKNLLKVIANNKL